MDDFNPAQDSQAAYNAMPDAGLTATQLTPAFGTPAAGMTAAQKQQLASMVMGIGKGYTQPGVVTPPATTQIPTMTLQAGQMINQAPQGR
jgi:hypothetical protein